MMDEKHLLHQPPDELISKSYAYTLRNITVSNFFLPSRNDPSNSKEWNILWKNDDSGYQA